MSRYGQRPLLAWATAAALTLAPTSIFAAQQPWDQREVTQIASKLAEAVSGVRDEFRKQPPITIASLHLNARYRLEDELRLLESETQELAHQLKSGEGLDATRPIYDRIGSLARDARENARKQLVVEQVQKRVDRAEELWAQLTPYYTNAPGPSEKSQ